MINSIYTTQSHKVLYMLEPGFKYFSTAMKQIRQFKIIQKLSLINDYYYYVSIIIIKHIRQDTFRKMKNGCIHTQKNTNILLKTNTNSD